MADPVALTTIIMNEDKDVNFQITDSDKNPLDISSATEIDCVFLKADGTCLHKKLSVPPEVVITNGPFGKFKAFIPAADAAILQSSVDTNGDVTLQSCEVRITLAGKLSTVQFPASLLVKPSLFPAC